MSGLNLTDRADVREVVRQKYGEAAKIVLDGRGEACCGTGNVGTRKSASCGESSEKDVITSNLYNEIEAGEIPEDALLASLGCGNPTALAQLNPGEIVLDLGSGGGIDVLLSAKRVGPAGFAYGLDMTDEMLALAEKNRAAAGAQNVKFLRGHIENIPLPDNSVDVIISNCVVNLSADKDAVLSEAFRVLKPGGRFAVSDVVVDGVLPDAIRTDVMAYVGCVAGALDKLDYLAKLEAAGFVDASIEPTRRYTLADLDSTSCCAMNVKSLSGAERDDLDGRVFSGFIRAAKPAQSEERACCGPTCCSPEAAA
jgi:SAM-dependent methyltransferase